MKWFLQNEKNKKILFFGDEISGNESYADKISDYFLNTALQYGFEVFKKPFEMQGGFEDALARERENIIKEEYDVVVFYFSAFQNDGDKSADDFERYTRSVKEFARGLKEAKISVCALTPAPFFKKDADKKENIKKYCDFVKELEDAGDILAAADIYESLSKALENEDVTKNDIHEIVFESVIKMLVNVSLTCGAGQFADSEYHGFARKNFYFEGYEASFILPKMFAAGRPWIWRAEFLGAFDSADCAMLENGWGIAYIRLNDMYGSESALSVMRRFQNEIVKRFELYEKCVLFGFSRGGLYSVNYASKYPECVSGLYLDNPVMDIYSWPGGFGKGCSDKNSEEWKECKIIFGVTDDGRESFKDNPKDKISSLIKNNLPVMLVAGGADSVVPFFENSFYLADEYLKNGGKLKLYLESWRDHHPHSLEQPNEIVRFILSDMAPDIY